MNRVMLTVSPFLLTIFIVASVDAKSIETQNGPDALQQAQNANIASDTKTPEKGVSTLDSNKGPRESRISTPNRFAIHPFVPTNGQPSPKHLKKNKRALIKEYKN